MGIIVRNDPQVTPLPTQGNRNQPVKLPSQYKKRMGKLFLYES